MDKVFSVRGVPGKLAHAVREAAMDRGITTGTAVVEALQRWLKTPLPLTHEQERLSALESRMKEVEKFLLTMGWEKKDEKVGEDSECPHIVDLMYSQETEKEPEKS